LNYNAAVASLITDGSTAKTNVTINNNGGAYAISNANNTFSGGFTIAYGGSGGGSRLYQGSITNTVVGGVLTKSNIGTGTLTIGANGSTFNAQLMLNSGSIYNNIIVNAAQYPDGGLAAFRLDGSGIQFYGTMTANSSNINLSSQITGSATLNGQLTGTNGLLLKTPAGVGATFTLTLANTLNPINNYSGNTTTSTRTTIALSAVTQIPNGTGKGNVVNNGTLTLGGLSHTINGLSGSGTIDGVSGTPTLTVGNNDATSSFSGVIKNTSGTLSLTKTGTGSLTLTGVNTYTGATSISAGSIITPKTSGASTGTATFTNTTLSVSFNVAPTAGMTFRYFPGTTTQTYASVTLVGAPGRTGVYTSANSTLTIA
jgi:autotransporter-associated beta strand protein